MKKRNLAWLKDHPIAHRGYHSIERPENSLAAFKIAVKQNYAIELNVQLTRDDQVLVFHDEDLERMCGEKKTVATLVRKDHLLYDLNDTDEKIPLLCDVLKIVDSKVPILIEIKGKKTIARTSRIILNTLLGYSGHVAIMSFNPLVLHWFAREAPTIPRGQLISNCREIRLNFLIRLLLRNMFFNFLSKPDFVAINIRDMNRKFVNRQHKLGRLVLGWTVDHENFDKTILEPLDNFIFENLAPVSSTDFKALHANL